MHPVVISGQNMVDQSFRGGCISTFHDIDRFAAVLDSG